MKDLSWSAECRFNRQELQKQLVLTSNVENWSEFTEFYGVIDKETLDGTVAALKLCQAKKQRGRNGWFTSEKGVNKCAHPLVQELLKSVTKKAASGTDLCVPETRDPSVAIGLNDPRTLNGQVCHTIACSIRSPALKTKICWLVGG